MFKSLPKILLLLIATFLFSLSIEPRGLLAERNSEAQLNTNARRPIGNVGDEVFGIADMHAHPFAYEAFGGLFFQGKTFDPEGIAAALTTCEHVHGSSGLKDIVGNAAAGRISHGTEAYPTFKGWPAWNSVNHQQMYYRWLERAHLGGLRLIVAHAVNSQALCKLVALKEGYSCNDMEAVDKQIEAAYALEDFVEKETGGKSWLKIVTSALEARQAIAEGKLAMVLGIEVDSLFDCSVGHCRADEVEAKLDHYYAKGIRHIIPIHVTDNAFGGAAMYNPYLFNYANRLLNGRFFEAEDCADEGYTYRETAAPLLPSENILAPLLPQYPAYRAFCNSRSLSRLGEVFLKQMMNRGMIIDVDHMSARTLNAALELAEAQHYPLASGHTGFVNTSAPAQKRSEAQKTDTQLRRILRLGGVVAPILQQGTAETEVLSGGKVENNCDRSSKSFSQAYLYALQTVREESEYEAVGIGTDFNGIIESAAPRFGKEACTGNRSQANLQRNPVTYPFRSQWVDGYFARQRTGDKTFDVNQHGFAHIGLLPDFIDDLSRVGMTNEDIIPLFRSAEAYLRMWEKAQAKKIQK